MAKPSAKKIFLRENIFKREHIMTDEIFPIVTPEGEVIGKATREECHSGTFLLHPVVHLHVFSPDGRLYLQKRSMEKRIQPGKWDTAVGGHVDFGETIEKALRRETREELGITDFEPMFVDKYTFRSKVEHELVYIYRCVYNGEIIPDPDEISEGRFWSHDEILAAIGNNILTPNFESEYNRIKNRF